MFNFVFDFYEKIVWVAVAIMFFIALGCRKKIPLKRRGGLGQPLPNPIAVILPIVFFTVMAGLRKNTGDTYYYALSFEEYLDANSPVTVKMFFTSMFSFFQNLIRRFTNDAQWLVFFSAVLSIPVPLYILYKYAYPFEYTIFLFVAYGYFGGLMNGMRQYMAAAIALCGTGFLFSLKKSSLIKYAAVIMLAWSMHKSALILIPLYFVVRRKAFQLSSYFIILGSVVATFAFEELLPSFLGIVEETEYSLYASNGWFTSGEEGGSSIGRTFLAIIPVVLAYMNRGRMKRLGHIGDILVNYSLINGAICLIATNNWIFVRLTIYMMIYYIILLVWILFYIIPPEDRMVYEVGITTVFFLYSRTQGYLISCYMSDYFFPERILFRRKI